MDFIISHLSIEGHLQERQWFGPEVHMKCFLDIFLEEEEWSPLNCFTVHYYFWYALGQTQTRTVSNNALWRCMYQHEETSLDTTNEDEIFECSFYTLVLQNVFSVDWKLLFDHSYKWSYKPTELFALLQCNLLINKNILCELLKMCICKI